MPTIEKRKSKINHLISFHLRKLGKEQKQAADQRRNKEVRNSESTMKINESKSFFQKDQKKSITSRHAN